MTDDESAKLRAMLFDALREYAEEASLDIEIGDDTPLFGNDSALDSIGLVTVLAEFEAAINDAFGTDLVLADDRAMALKRSPFRTPARLLEFAAQRLAAAQAE
jgi:hypothetical protein